MLLIKLHDGPARLGKYNELNTPGILEQFSEFDILKDEPMPYDVPKLLAEWSVNRTTEFAKKGSGKGIAVIHGSKYVDLRIKSAKELDGMGYTIMAIANSEKLLKNPRDLVEIIVNIRKIISPNVALYFPFADASFIPLLVYMGVDLFGDAAADYYAYLNKLLTPSAIYDLDEYKIYDFSQDELRNYNKNTLDFVMREIRENIKNLTLRNLVEERCCTSPEAMSALRILDKKYSEFLDRYTPLY
jgi:tRNA-guanine family transglycosylase